MIIASFMGLLALSSCIDGVESPSVTAVRDAKTAELQSIAAMDKAEAEAMVALANADAALKAAQAAAEEAYAERAAAQAAAEALEQQLIDLQKELLTLQTEEARLANQAEQARLEAELEKEKVRQAEAEAALEAIKAQMELAKVENEKAMLEAELAIKQANDALAAIEEALANAETEAERAEILQQQALYQEYALAYSDALKNYIQVKKALNSLNWKLVEATNNLASEQEIKNETIADNNVTIAEYNVYIENYKKYENYSEDIDALKRDYKAAQEAYYLALDLVHAKSNEYNSAYDAIDPVPAAELLATIENSDFYNFYANRTLTLSEGNSVNVRNLIDPQYEFYLAHKYNPDDEDEWLGNYGHQKVVVYEHETEDNVLPYKVNFYAIDFSTPDPDIFDLTWDGYLVDAQKNIDKAEAYLAVAESKYDGTKVLVAYEDEKKGWTTKETDDKDAMSAVKAFEEAEEAFEEAKEAYDEDIVELKEALDAAKEAATNALYAFYGADDAYYWDPTPENEAALNAATEAYNAALAAQDEAQAAYDEVQLPYDEAKNAYFTAMDNVEIAKQAVAEAQEDYDIAVAELEAYELGASFVHDYDKHLAELQVVIDELNALYVSQEEEAVKLWGEYMKLSDAEVAAEAEMDAINHVLNEWVSNDYGSIYPAYYIADQITYYEGLIEKLEQDNADLTAIETAEALIETLNKRIAIKEVQLQTAEAALNIAKAALESLTKENPAA